MNKSITEPSPELELRPSALSFVYLQVCVAILWIFCLLGAVIVCLAFVIPPFNLPRLLRILPVAPILLGLLLFLRTLNRVHQNHRLVFNEEGISWHYGWVILKSSWENVEFLGTIHISYQRMLGLKLREPGQLTYSGPLWMKPKPKDLMAIPFKPFTLPEELPGVLLHYRPALDLSVLPATIRPSSAAQSTLKSEMTEF